MKTVIIIVIVVILLVVLWMIRQKSGNNPAPMQFVTLDNDKTKVEMLPKVPNDWVEEVSRKYESKEYSKYDNVHYAFTERLVNQLYSDYKYWDRNETHYDFLSKLHDTQKMYFAIVNFEAQTNNGGVYQFLFNQPENSIVALEAMRAAKLDKLAQDYEIVLNQFFGKFHTIDDLKSKFQNENLNWKKRWNSFVEGYKTIPQAKVIEGYFYDEEYCREFHLKMAKFVIDNQNELMKTE